MCIALAELYQIIYICLYSTTMKKLLSSLMTLVLLTGSAFATTVITPINNNDVANSGGM